MRVTFPRLPDHQRAWALVERDDGVVYRLYGGDRRAAAAARHHAPGGGAGTAHQGRHLGRHRGGRGSLFSGAPAARVGPACREQGLLADLVSSAATLDTMTLDKIKRLSAAKLSVLPDADVDPVVIAAAARALQVEAARWARLRIGEELSYDWPGK